jgi:CRP-like cAMP-binding protein
MISVYLQKLRQRIEISSDEERAIRDSITEIRQIGPDRLVIRAGEELNESLMLLDGWLARCKDLAGGERQVMQLHVAGDFADLHGFTLKKLDHDVATLSECRLAVVPHEKLQSITESLPRLARIYWFTTNVDAAIQRELALSLGQRSAISRMAHLFCELDARLEVVGRAKNGEFQFPLTQRELSECLGLTVVHANRTLQELRRRRLVDLENRWLTIRDRGALEAVAEFDPSYLYLNEQPL